MHEYIAQPGASGGLAGALNTLKSNQPTANSIQRLTHRNPDTPNGPAALPRPRNLAASARLHALPAFCSRIACAIRIAFATECRGNFALPPAASADFIFVGFFDSLSDFFVGIAIRSVAIS
jgi:hypothetical protein